MTVQTTVEVPQLLGVPVEIPQVQFLDKFDTPVVYKPIRGGRVFEFCIPVEVNMDIVVSYFAAVGRNQ